MGRSLHDWAAVQAYHDEGHGFVECAKKFGFSHTAWIKAIKSGRLRVKATPFRDRRRKYDWAEIQAYYDAGYTYLECMEYFGFCSKGWNAAVERGEIKAGRRGRFHSPIEWILRSKASRWHKKLRLLREGLLTNRCQRCGLIDWRGKPLAIHIDHINGLKDDWRLENLRMLCPQLSQSDAHLRWTKSSPLESVAFGLGGRMRRDTGIDRRRRYDWSEVQRYYNEGNSITHCMERFGFCRGAWQKAIKRGDLKTRPVGRPLQELLTGAKSRKNVKRRLLRAGLLQNRCSECGITEWLGERLSVQIDHINGVNDDYRLENLRMLCPNCHSQTETYGIRNRRPHRLQDPPPLV